MIRRLLATAAVGLLLAGVAAAETLESVEKKLAELAGRITSYSARFRTEKLLGEGSMTNKTLVHGTFEYLVSGGEYLMRKDSTQHRTVNFRGNIERLHSSSQSICDGRFTWNLNENDGKKVATKEPLTPRGDLNPLQSLHAQYDLTLLPDDRVDGLACYVISAKPKSNLPAPAPGLKRRYWYSKEAGVLIREVVYDIKGKVMTTTTYTDMRINPPIPRERFTFVPPPDAKVFDTTIEQPPPLPPMPPSAP